MPFAITSDECELYVKEWGEGKPVILIHGWPLNADSWDDIALGLAEAGYRAIAYDRRGFGRSEQPWTGNEYDTFADDLAEVIDQCDAEGAAIVGFSMGGGEVARYLGKYGADKISHAALIGSVVPFLLKTEDHPNGADPSVFDGMIEGIREDRAGFMQTFAKNFYGVGFISKPVSQGVLDAFFQSALMGGLWPTLACVTAFGTTDFRADCAAFTVPTLILHGTDDKIVPIDISAREAAKLIPHAQVVEYPGGPHGLLATHKADVLRDLLAFLAGEEVGPNEEMTTIDPAIAGLQPLL